MDPPRLRWTRLVGMSLIASGLLGILLSIGGMVLVGRATSAAQQSLARQIDTLDSALSATGEGLALAGDILSDLEGTLGSLSTAVSGATRAISDTEPALVSLQALTGDSLPRTIGSTRQALASAQETARIVDNVLGTLGIFGVRYEPEVPLHSAIGEVSDSLAPIPGSLIEVSAGLATANDNLHTLTEDLSEVATGLDRIAASVDESTAIVDEYTAVVDTLRADVAALRESAPGWINLARWGGFVLMAWFGLAQIGLLAQGRELLARDRESYGVEVQR